MSDCDADFDPAIAALRSAARRLEDGERDIASACGGLLLRLADPLDLHARVEFYDFLAFRDEALREALCRRAARAAMAVLLADGGMMLPANIAVYFDLPEAPKAPPPALSEAA